MSEIIKKLFYRYQQDGFYNLMSVTFNNKNLLHPIVNLGGSIYQGKVAVNSQIKTGNTIGRNTQSVAISFNNEGLPNGIINRITKIELANVTMLARGLLGVMTPVLHSEENKLRVNGLLRKENGQINTENIKVSISIDKEKNFSLQERIILKNIINKSQKNS